MIGDLNHLYHESHAPLGRQIDKEIEVAIEAKAEKVKRPMYEAGLCGISSAKRPEPPVGYPSKSPDYRRPDNTTPIVVYKAPP